MSDNHTPAFPSPACSQNASTGETISHQSEAGMSLRDYFAAKAMQMKFGVTGASFTKDRMAAECYEMADSMMKAREQ